MNRTMPLLLALTLASVSLRGGSPPPPVSARETARAAAPILSALVSVAGQSGSQALRLAGGSAADAGQARSLARAEAERLAVAEVRVRQAQAPIVAAARTLGVKVISRYTTAANGLLVHATAAQLAALRRAPGVVAIEPAPLVRLHLARSVPYIGADVLAERLGYIGKDTVVAVIDTGIDYTHADFGGPGDPGAYAAAAAAAETIADTWQGQPLFPTSKVIGGWDFVGPNYTSPAQCPPAEEQAGLCTSTPHPDPDPLDMHSHGTHVAGIAAGSGTDIVHSGVAPGARLVALKIHGPPARPSSTDEAVDVAIDAIEWCTRVNLGLAVPGTVPPRVDVINMSFGEDFAQGSRLFDAAVEAATGAGIVVVASAGNSQDRPFILGAPSASPLVLSVASAYPATTGGSGVAQEPVDVMSSFSSRGPSKNGALKPDLAGPGSGIVSAQRGSGTAGVNLSGTSMASPHVAGAAALLWQRNRAERLDLVALDVAALLMNYARTSIYPNPSPGNAPLSVARQGAGRLDVLRAGTGKLLVRAGDIASINLGAASFSGGPEVQTVPLAVRNLSDSGMYVLAESHFISSGDAGRGLEVELPNEPLRLEARGALTVPARFRVTPARFRDWLLAGTEDLRADRLDTQSIDGFITLTPVDAAGQAITTELAASVPFYLLPRRASAIRGSRQAASADERAATLRFVNGGHAGHVELFILPAGAEEADPDELEVLHELDLARVGVRVEVDEPAAGEPTVSFGIGLHDVAPIPQVTSLEVYLDTDRDGRPDHRLRRATQAWLSGQAPSASDRMAIGVAPWDAAAGATAGPESITPSPPINLYTRVMVLAVPLASVGLQPDQPFDFYVVYRGLNEDWWNAPTTDVAPDGAVAADGPRYRFDPAAWSELPEASPELARPWSFAVADHGTVEVPLARRAGRQSASFLALYPDNRFEPDQAQMEALGERVHAGEPLYLPHVTNRW
jgi:subtilisin family serine protease